MALRSSQEQAKIRVICSVTDNGPGMSDVVLDSLFQKFSQASAKTHVQYGGSGLGLYISKRLTELLGGSIEATSTLGHGTCLTFSIVAESAVAPEIPAPKVVPAPKVIAAIEAILGTEAIFYPFPKVPIEVDTSQRRSTLLIVEDNLVNQRLMCKVLGTSYNLHTANNGLECVEYMQSPAGNEIDLVLCDIEMRK